MSAADLLAHLATGATHVCHCWSVVRRDGLALGFTDHDRAIRFDGIEFLPESGLSARALASTTGLSVNNTEAIGVLSADAITEGDIDAGRYDGAAVTTWLVQWDNPAARQVRFSGTIGEIARESGGFRAELRGLTDALNQPQGRSYFTSCSVVLGDARCSVDFDDPTFGADAIIDNVANGQFFSFLNISNYHTGWFDAGFLEVQSGAAQGLSGVVRRDELDGDVRRIRLWEPIRALIAAGDAVRLIAGCDKRAVTCREKFANLVNFQGFPDIPGDDWLASVPRANGANTGRSRSR